MTEPIVSSIWATFRHVHPTAIPAMLDCLLSCTAASPSSLFNDLLSEFHVLVEENPPGGNTMGFQWCNCVGSYVAAQCHFLKKLGSNDIEMFIWKVLIPLLKLLHTYDMELFNQVLNLFLDVVTETNNWEVLEDTMVPLLLRSIGVSVGILQSEENAIYKWSVESSLGCSCKRIIGLTSYNEMDMYHHNDISLSVSSNILTLILDAAFPDKSKEGVVSASNSLTGSNVALFVGNMLWDLCNMTFQILSQNIEHRSLAIRFLLPLLLKVFTHDHTFEVVCMEDHVLTRNQFFTKLWKCCKLLFSLGSLERRDAYNVLSLYLSFSTSFDEHDYVNVYKREDILALRADQEFWDEMKKGLLDKNGFVRKQSLDILKTTLNLSQERKSCEVSLVDQSNDKINTSFSKSKKQRWADNEAKSLGVGRVYNDTGSVWLRWEAFIFQYEMLEEYGIHLVEAAWNHQITLWLQSLSGNELLKFSSGELHANQMITPDQIFEWLAILWERGFCHDNPQVRCLIMQSFLAIEWDNDGSFATMVPRDFILGPLICGLNDPVQHKDFGLKENYSSWAIEAAAKFLHRYTSAMHGRVRVLFLVNLASIAKSHAFGRAGLMCLAECIASASCAIQKPDNHESKRSDEILSEEVLVESKPIFYDVDKSNLLDALRFILECSKQHFNPKYRHKVCGKVLSSASLVMDAVDIPFEILLYFISSLPREYTDIGGSLRDVVRKWLCSHQSLLLKAIDGFPPNFICPQLPPGSLVDFDDEELDAWGSWTKRWARILFLVVEDEHHLDFTLKFIQNNGGDISKQKNCCEWLEVKFLILVYSLVEELHIMRHRMSYYQATIRTKAYLVVHEKVEDQCLMIVSMFDKFVTIFLSILEELVSFTQVSCSVFWTTVEMEDRVLPGSVKGRLGGQSQRRLSRSLSTSVLRAITSVKTLAFIMRWCSQFKSVNILDSTHTFLWGLCWKIIRLPICKSEVEAEIITAAYEACSYALRELAPIISPLSLDIFNENSMSYLLEADGQPVFDEFSSTFICKINSVIDGGNLVRSRRAILMKWKWNCLESLLSLPNHALCNGVCTKRDTIYFSDTTIRLIFGDLVGSLENAGESTVLPLLKSVRLSIELFALKTKDPGITFCEGITIEMMWFLVRSSWILHVSCNKKRVASIAALLSSILHYRVFGDERMHEFASGPLKWFVKKILEEGTKSPRTIRLAALHLAGLWLAYPNTLKFYMEDLKLLTLYGSVAFDEDFEAELVENYDARSEVSELSNSLDPDLTEGFINTELYARVSVAVLFSKLADMANLVKSTDSKDSLSLVSSGKMFLLELLDFAVNDKDISKELYKKYSSIHRRKVRVWQMICVLSRFVDHDIVEQVTTRLQTSISRNNLPSVRQYMETISIYVYLKFPSLIGQQLVLLLRNYELRPQAISSYVFIAANVILHGHEETPFGHLDELLPPIIPLLTSHHHTLRGFSQVLVYEILLQLLPDSNLGTRSEIFLEKKCFADLRSYLANNPDCARLRASMDCYLRTFDPIKSVSPRGVFTNRIEEVEFECVPTTLMDRVTDFLNETREDLRSSMAKDAATIQNTSLHMNEQLKCSEISYLDKGQSEVLQPKELSIDFQKKITFSKHEQQHPSSALENKLCGSLLDMENADQILEQMLQSRESIAQKLKKSRQKIIIFASLIDRIPNLAGLARTCEIFGAGGLAIADKIILNDKQFQLISVTADKWVPVVEVPVRNMRLFLEKKKKDGFAILGLEQTANSVPLDQYNFPVKSVLVLGREKEGIPVDIIHMLDACIEIPQLGVIRSLNVHVSGAIALWEYTRQHRELPNLAEVTWGTEGE